MALCLILSPALAPARTFEADDMNVIKRAAERNDCGGEDFRILLAIRRAENGPPGREWGIMAPAANTFELQAAWAAVTIIKNRKRWSGEGDFVTFLRSRYAPMGAKNDPENLNRNWIRNVKYWLTKIN